MEGLITLMGAPNVWQGQIVTKEGEQAVDKIM